MISEPKRLISKLNLLGITTQNTFIILKIIKTPLSREGLPNIP